MKQNESNIDRIIRAITGIVLLFMGIGGFFSGTLAIIADAIGAILLLTAAIGFCPIYALLKIKQVRNKSSKRGAKGMRV